MTVPVAWTRREIVWLRAALTLPAYEFLSALDDIASMSGRTISAVASKARHLREINSEPAPLRHIVVPRPNHTAADGGCIRPPSMAQLMAGRAK